MVNDKMIYVDEWTHKYLRSIRKGGESIGAATKRISEFYEKSHPYEERISRIIGDWMNHYSAFSNGQYLASCMTKTKEDAKAQALKNGIEFDEMKDDE